MIYTNMEHIRRYMGLDEKLDKAIEYLLSADIPGLAPGAHEIDGRDVFINRQEYDSIPPDKASWEGHRDYLDIHIVLEGEEKIGVSDISRLQCLRFDEENDYYSFAGEPDVWFNMRPGDLLILWPEDAHMVRVQRNGVSHLQKACMKVRI